MQHARRGNRLAALIAAALIAAFVVPAAAQAQEMSATIQYDTAGGQQEMKVFVGPDASRMDMQQISIVFGADFMTMIMHEQQMYMRWTKEMMERMQEMMGRMGGMMGGADDTDVVTVDPESMTFEETGRTDTIAGVEAFEVAWTSDEHRGSLWMTEALDVGMFEVFSGMMQRMADMDMPFMNRMTQGDNPMDMRRYFEYARAQGLPDGRVVRVVNEDEGVTITLMEVESGPLPAGTFEAPEGYTEQQMPMMQR